MDKKALADGLRELQDAARLRTGGYVRNTEAIALIEMLFELDAADELPWPKEENSRA